MDYGKIQRFGGYCGIAAIAIYVLCSLAAAFQFPAHYSPFDNWISDLGSYAKNPAGAIVYNVGAGAAALLLVPLFLSLMAWHKQAGKYRALYVGAEIFGLLAALGLLMHAVFQEGTSWHTFWATVCFGSMVVVLALANAALLRHPKFNKSIGYYGFFAALVGLIFFALFVALENPPIIMEWAAAYAGFLWVWLFSWNGLHYGHNGHNGHNGHHGAVSRQP